MTNLLLRLFVDNKHRTPTERRLRIGTVGGACGIIANLLLSVIKLMAGIVFHSIALVADAVNNVTDAASSVITFVGFKLSAKKPDSDHPYGHGRVEYVSGLVMAFMVLVLGLTLAKSALERVLSPEPLIFSYLGVAAMVISIVVKLWLSVFYKKLQTETDSSTFGAASCDSRNDVISTSAVLVCTLIYAFTDVNLDGIVGLAVSVFILVSGIGLIKETLDPLLGQPPPPELVDEISAKVLSYDEIIGIHDLVVHNYGPGRMFASLHVEVAHDSDFMYIHDLVDNIEKDFMSCLGIETVIHMDPIVTDDPVINDLRAHIIDITADIDKRLTIHDFRAVPGPTHTNVIFDIVVPADICFSDKELKEKIDIELTEMHPECFTVITFDRSYI